MKTLIYSLTFAVAFAAPALAQERPPAVPVEYRPPAGMCRIWIDAVPPGQQPAPTDCPTAVKNRPAKARVIFGDDYVERKANTQKLPFVKSFTGTPTPAPLDKAKKPDDPRPDPKVKRPEFPFPG
jgi:hypothetical protein